MMERDAKLRREKLRRTLEIYTALLSPSVTVGTKGFTGH
jgi:hypothetical protein